MRKILFVLIAAALVAVGVGWVMTTTLSRWSTPDETGVAPASEPTPEPVRRIRATLFYVSEDGSRLVAVPREVVHAEDTAQQAMRLIEAQVEPAPEPYAQAIPTGTSVRAVFIAEGGDAFVDLSAEVAKAHTGGSLDELFSVYAIVNLLTVNLPAIHRVQILVDGKEVDSLAGHVDLRRPLPRSLKWVDSTPVPVG
jgi:hypothetical protein